jgi:hypothetical protein
MIIVQEHATLALVLFTITVNRWNKPSMDSPVKDRNGEPESGE